MKVSKKLLTDTCDRVDRLARSLSALLAAYDALEALHVTIKSATEPFETSTPIGKFLFSLLGSLAELEKSTIIERLTLGRDRNVRNGRWFVNTVPLGYDVEDGVLVPSQRIVPALGMTEIAMVHELFQHIADGSSAVEECRRLQALGVAPSKRYSKRGEVTEARRWHISKIVSILHNPVYIGQHTFASKHGTITRDVPAIIDKALWERAQQTLANNRKLPKHQRHRSYLLRGLIKCGLCGLTFVGQPVNRPRNRVKKLDFYYRCSGRSGSVYPDAKDRCCNRHVRAEQLEELIWSDCLEFIHNPGAALHIAKQQLQGRQARTANVEQEKQRLQQALAAKTEEREMMLVLFQVLILG